MMMSVSVAIPVTAAIRDMTVRTRVGAFDMLTLQPAPDRAALALTNAKNAVQNIGIARKPVMICDVIVSITYLSLLRL